MDVHALSSPTIEPSMREQDMDPLLPQISCPCEDCGRTITTDLECTPACPGASEPMLEQARIRRQMNAALGELGAHCGAQVQLPQSDCDAQPVLPTADINDHAADQAKRAAENALVDAHGKRARYTHQPTVPHEANAAASAQLSYPAGMLPAMATSQPPGLYQQEHVYPHDMYQHATNASHQQHTPHQFAVVDSVIHQTVNMPHNQLQPILQTQPGTYHDMQSGSDQMMMDHGMQLNDDMLPQRQGFCHHGRQRYRCKDCGGAGICSHGRQRNGCKECKGSSICPHGRQRCHCKDCKGSSICHHGRIRSVCKACGGGSICHHGRIRSVCKECGGSSFCEHGRRRGRCKECGGNGFCEHGRIKSACKECGAAGFCSHGRRMSRCKECGGSGLCKHGRRPSRCKECGGKALCKHGRRPSRCKDCGGSSLCTHQRQRNKCKDCRLLEVAQQVVAVAVAVREAVPVALGQPVTGRPVEQLRGRVPDTQAHEVDKAAVELTSIPVPIAMSVPDPNCQVSNRSPALVACIPESVVEPDDVVGVSIPLHQAATVLLS